MIFDFDVPYSQISFGQRAEMATTHLLNIPEKVLNVIVQIVKLVVCAFGAALACGQSTYLNENFMLAGRRTLINAAGIGTSLIGFFAPMKALEWQMRVIENLLGDMKNIKQVEAKLITATLAI